MPCNWAQRWWLLGHPISFRAHCDPFSSAWVLYSTEKQRSSQGAHGKGDRKDNQWETGFPSENQTRWNQSKQQIKLDITLDFLYLNLKKQISYNKFAFSNLVITLTRVKIPFGFRLSISISRQSSPKSITGHLHPEIKRRELIWMLCVKAQVISYHLNSLLRLAIDWNRFLN